MKLIAIAVCVVVSVLAVASIAQTPAKPKSESVKQELIKLENGWNDAVLKRDLAFLDRILADDFTIGEVDGTVTTKAQLLAYIKSGEYAVASSVYADVKVRVYGDAAVVMGHTAEKSRFKGADMTGEYLWTDTWVKIAGRWQCVAAHSSKIAQK
jgi:ketosteroid isomerase-like protein